ncbi:TVP38/TMEM64 family protein [Nitrospira sp. BLG_1]|uniref:TVP38/TMEM64 family protein n=1 Tax=Nitrospira sp. BLG_1 TaxID=3395883 RepID=UPI0039BD1C1E
MAATRTSWLKLGALFAVLGGAYAVVSWFDIGELLKPEQVSDQIRAAGPFGPILFMLLMATAVVISPIPSLPLDLAAGATFGVTLGTVYAVIGAEFGAILSFLIGRSLGREALTRLLRIDISFCERCSDRHLAFFVFLSRLLPIFSFDFVSYGAGLTNMTLRAFAVATLLGMIGPTFLLTYAGEQVISGEWLLIVLGLIMVAMLLLIPKLVLRYPTARWVRLLRGDMPVASPLHVSPTQPVTSHPDSASRCDFCGESPS